MSLYGPELFEPSTAVSAGNEVTRATPAGAGLVVADNTFKRLLSDITNIFYDKN